MQVKGTAFVIASPDPRRGHSAARQGLSAVNEAVNGPDALGVRAASLYCHVEDKDALLDLVLVEVGTQLGPGIIEEYRTVETLDEWIEVTRRTTLMAYDFHAQHPVSLRSCLNAP